MLYTPPLPTKPASAPGLRHRCRNPRCGLKLRPPTDRLLDAFCCRTCFESFYQSRCLVCERPIERKTGRRQVCGRSKCRHEFQRHRERFSSTRYPALVLGHNASRSAHSTDLKSRSKDGRPLTQAYRQIAGPTLSSTPLRLASLLLDPDFAARIARANAHEVEARAKAKRKAQRTATIKRRHSPVNVLGGYRFPSAPTVDLSPTDPPAEWAIQSRWKPAGDGAEVPDIPDFLRRNPISAAIPTRCSEEAATVPGDDLDHRSERRKVANA
jgi:hypothetical protein